MMNARDSITQLPDELSDRREAIRNLRVATTDLVGAALINLVCFLAMHKVRVFCERRFDFSVGLAASWNVFAVKAIVMGDVRDADWTGALSGAGDSSPCSCLPGKSTV